MQAVFFDLDDTLLWDSKCVKEAFAITCKEASKRTGVDAKKVEDSVRDVAPKIYATYDVFPFTKMIGINPFEGLWGTFNDGTFEFPKLEAIAPIYQKQAWTKALEALGIHDEKLGSELALLFKKSRENLSFLYPETLDILEKLKGHFRLALITNGSPSLQNHKIEKAEKLRPYFDEIIISGEHGKGKPHPTVFNYALSQLNIDKNEAIMVGDNLHTDILGANTTGLKSIWINHDNKTATEDNQPTHTVTSLKEIIPILLNDQDVGRI